MLDTDTHQPLHLRKLLPKDHIRYESGIQACSRRIPCGGRVLSGLEMLQILCRKLKIVDLLVLFDSRWRNTFREDNKALLQSPSQEDLRRCFAVLRCQWLQQRIVHALASDQG